MKKIVDAEGQNAGFRTFVEAMESQLRRYSEERFSLKYHEELLGIDPAPSAGGAVVLHFASGKTVAAQRVLLNLPQLPLLKVLDKSEALLRDGLPPSLQTPAPADGVKLYVHYRCTCPPLHRRRPELAHRPALAPTRPLPYCGHSLSHPRAVCLHTAPLAPPA